MPSEKLVSAMNIIKRMPPRSTETVLKAMINLAPEISEELLQFVDQPLKTMKDPVNEKKFIVCDFNRDGDFFRSPHSNTYVPEPKSFKPFFPSKEMRQMELMANSIFDQYRHLYYQGGSSSVYFWEMDGDDFASCWLVHKKVDGERDLDSGYWDSIHVFEVRHKAGNTFCYQLTTTVIVEIAQECSEMGEATISGSKSNQKAATAEASSGEEHIATMGKMLEDSELDLRGTIQTIYIQKTREVIEGMVSADHWGNAGEILGKAVGGLNF